MYSYSLGSRGFRRRSLVIAAARGARSVRFVKAIEPRSHEDHEAVVCESDIPRLNHSTGVRGGGVIGPLRGLRDFVVQPVFQTTERCTLGAECDSSSPAWYIPAVPRGA